MIRRRLAKPIIAPATPHLRVAVALATLLVAAGCGGTVSSSAVPVSPASIAPADSQAAVPSQTVGPSAAPELMLAVVGDSIPFNKPGFVDRYAAALQAATGKAVVVRNMSQHTNLKVQDLLDELPEGSAVGRSKTLSEADAIIVGIAHNDVPWNVNDDACDGPNGDDIDWSKYTAVCIAGEVKRLTPKYEALFKRIAELRAGKPTVLRTINRYNDWIGWPGHPEAATEGIAESAAVVAAWNKMICGAAEANGFTCADISTAFNGTDGTEPSGALLAADYIHPSAGGDIVIADVLAELGFEPLVP